MLSGTRHQPVHIWHDDRCFSSFVPRWFSRRPCLNSYIYTEVTWAHGRDHDAHWATISGGQHGPDTAANRWAVSMSGNKSTSGMRIAEPRRLYQGGFLGGLVCTATYHIGRAADSPLRPLYLPTRKPLAGPFLLSGKMPCVQQPIKTRRVVGVHKVPIPA